MLNIRFSPTNARIHGDTLYLVSTIIGAVLTPSTDPLTQVLLSSAILLLIFFWSRDPAFNKKLIYIHT